MEDKKIFKEQPKEMTLEDRCLWKTIAIEDQKKIDSGNYIITLSAEKPCYDCTGYNTGCAEYWSKKEVQNGIGKYD